MSERVTPQNPFGESYQPPAVENILRRDIQAVIEADLLMRELMAEKYEKVDQCREQYASFLDYLTDEIATLVQSGDPDSGFDKDKFTSGQPYSTTIGGCSSVIDLDEYGPDILETVVGIAVGQGIKQGLGTEINMFNVELRSVYSQIDDEVNVSATPLQVGRQ